MDVIKKIHIRLLERKESIPKLPHLVCCGGTKFEFVFNYSQNVYQSEK